jgi:DNA polymerase III epsilon subunit-like protein
MIVVDLETSGVDLEKCGIWQIGAVDTNNSKNTFLQESRLGDDYEFIFEGNWKGKKPEETLGLTEQELRDKKKQSEKELLEKFFDWVKKCKNKTFICQNPQFDHAFLEQKARKYNLEFPSGHRAIDMHTLAHFIYFQLNNSFVIKEDKSDFGLKRTLELVGMKDERKFHNALEDAKLTAEAFFRLVYGKNFLVEYSKFPVPEYLIKGGIKKKY